MAKDTMTAGKLRDHMDWTPEQLQNLIAHGLPYSGSGNSKRFNLAEIEDWLQDNAPEIAKGLSMEDPEDPPPEQEKPDEKPAEPVDGEARVAPGSEHRVCERCSTDEQVYLMEPISGGRRGLFVWYRCPKCGLRRKVQRPQARELLQRQRKRRAEDAIGQR